MRYIDSGIRDASQAVGTWLRHALTDDAIAIRWQSGFFNSDSIAFLQPTLSRLAENNQLTHALIGSNDQCTLRQDVEELASVLHLPRSEALLGIVSYRSGYYHAKTIHVSRADGTQTGYVGSANLTGSGISSFHVEAGLTLDTRDGDSTEILALIASTVDWWFQANPPGLYTVSSLDDVPSLVQNGVLSERPPLTPPRAARQARNQNDHRIQLDALQPLLPIPRRRIASEAQETQVEAAEIRSIILPATPVAGFPAYLLFSGDPFPTQGATALTGSSLPSGVSGLIIQLNRDSGRHFERRGGTANISLPVPTLTTLRFGRMSTGSHRPRAEFDLLLRYLSVTSAITYGPVQTNVMAYGFDPNEPGHQDVRMVVPAAVRLLAEVVREGGFPVPRVGDVVLLEWPTLNPAHRFRLTFLQPDSQLFVEAANLLRFSHESGTTVGVGACWLPTNLSPSW